MRLTVDVLRQALPALHSISMKYLYNRFRTTTIKQDKTIYGFDSIGCISYTEGYGLIICENGKIKELPDTFFPQALVLEIEEYLEKLTPAKTIIDKQNTE